MGKYLCTCCHVLSFWLTRGTRQTAHQSEGRITEVWWGLLTGHGLNEKMSEQLKKSHRWCQVCPWMPELLGSGSGGHYSSWKQRLWEATGEPGNRTEAQPCRGLCKREGPSGGDVLLFSPLFHEQTGWALSARTPGLKRAAVCSSSERLGTLTPSYLLCERMVDPLCAQKTPRLISSLLCVTPVVVF